MPPDHPKTYPTLRIPTPDEVADIENRTNYHAPDDDARARHQEVRDVIQAAMYDIVALTTPGREADLALTKLEQAMFWANASIARISIDGVRL